MPPPPGTYLSNDGNVSRVRYVQFFVPPPEVILRRSVVEITRSETYAGAEPLPNGLFDTRMGVTDRAHTCRTCDQDLLGCPGHEGHITLAKPVFHVKFMGEVTRILRCICYRCSSLLVDPASREVRALLAKRISRQKRFDYIIKNLCMRTCPACRARQPDSTKADDKMKIVLEWRELPAAGSGRARGGGGGSGREDGMAGGGGGSGREEEEQEQEHEGEQGEEEEEEGEEATADTTMMQVERQQQGAAHEWEALAAEEQSTSAHPPPPPQQPPSHGGSSSRRQAASTSAAAAAPPAGGAREIRLNAEDVLRLFRRVTEEHAEVIGFSSRTNRPEWLICTVLPVLPPTDRPSVRNDTGQRSEDDITKVYIDIVKFNNALKALIERGASHQSVEVNTDLVQYHVAQLVDNTKPNMNYISKDRSGRVHRTFVHRLKAKEGRIRGNLMGKRVNTSGRTVITPDPRISLDGVGVPYHIAMNLTFPEIVGPQNREQLQRLVDNGPDVHPGAKQVIKAHQGMRTIRLRPQAVAASATPEEKSAVAAQQQNPDLRLEIGDVVERHMTNDDVVLFNRQPSLHKVSMMAHLVRVMPYKSFRLNVCACKSYNADFDGDEMNMHLPQSLQTREEIRQLAAVAKQVVGPRDSRPIMSIVQDALLGVYRMTQRDVRVSARAFMNLLCSNPGHDGLLPPPLPSSSSSSGTAGGGGGGAWTGRQLLSSVIPPDVNVEMGNKIKDSEDPGYVPEDHRVVIRGGDIRQGIVNGDVYGKQSIGLVHATFNDQGPDAVVGLLNNTQKLVCDWLVLSGFSVGVADLVVPKSVKATLRAHTRDVKQGIAAIIQDVHAGRFENCSTGSDREYFEERVSKVLNDGVKHIENTTLDALAVSGNRMYDMVTSGSKGKKLNLKQMTGSLGQQIVDGRRVADGFDHRPLPHFTKFDDGPTARGYVEHSFVDGLAPHEFFFHSMGGRIGLIDTAVRTSETGYIQRKLVKAMEDCSVRHDLTVRNAVGHVVQFQYGYDGIDCTRLEAQQVPTVDVPASKLADAHLVAHSEELAPYLDPALLRALRADEAGLQADMLEHYRRLHEDRRLVIKHVNARQPGSAVVAPVHVQRVLRNTVQVLEDYGMLAAPSDLDPRAALRALDALLARLRPEPTPLFAALLRCHLSPKALLARHRLNAAGFERVLQVVEAAYVASAAQAGDVVGVTAAQSIGEMLTQATLNSFHASGTATAAAATQGVARLRELFDVTRQIKTPIMSIHVPPGYSKADAESVMNTIQTARLRDVVRSTQVFFDPFDDPARSLSPEDGDLLRLHSAHARLAADASCEGQGEGEAAGPRRSGSPWVLRLEFDRFAMHKLQIYFSDIRFALSEQYNDMLSCVFSDDNSARLVARVRLAHAGGGGGGAGGAETTDRNDLLTEIIALEQSMLDSVKIKGVERVERAAMESGKRKVYDDASGTFVDTEEWVIRTSGSNMVDVLANPYVDASRTFTNDVLEVFDVLGIEAARAVLFRELCETLQTDSNSISFRHLALLIDTMTNRGHPTGINRSGINKGDIGPLAKCSFEETDTMLLRAGLFCETDRMNGVSANIMLGQVPPCGTGDGDVLMDTAAMLRAPAESPWIDAFSVSEGGRLAPLHQQQLQQQQRHGGEETEREGRASATAGMSSVAMPEADEGRVVEKEEDDIIIT